MLIVFEQLEQVLEPEDVSFAVAAVLDTVEHRMNERGLWSDDEDDGEDQSTTQAFSAERAGFANCGSVPRVRATERRGRCAAFERHALDLLRRWTTPPHCSNDGDAHSDTLQRGRFERTAGWPERAVAQAAAIVAARLANGSQRAQIFGLTVLSEGARRADRACATVVGAFLRRENLGLFDQRRSALACRAFGRCCPRTQDSIDLLAPLVSARDLGVAAAKALLDAASFAVLDPANTPQAPGGSRDSCDSVAVERFELSVELRSELVALVSEFDLLSRRRLAQRVSKCCEYREWVVATFGLNLFFLFVRDSDEELAVCGTTLVEKHFPRLLEPANLEILLGDGLGRCCLTGNAHYSDRACLDDDRADVRTRACELVASAWRDYLNCSQPSRTILGRLLTAMQIAHHTLARRLADPSDSVRIATVVALTAFCLALGRHAGFARHADLRSYLRRIDQLALTDPDEDVRDAARGALVEIFKDLPETRGLLLPPGQQKITSFLRARRPPPSRERTLARPTKIAPRWNRGLREFIHE